MRSLNQLRSDASRIWSAALHAVDAKAAVRKCVTRRQHELRAGKLCLDLRNFGRVWVIGAGKAAAHMGQALEQVLGKFVTGGLLVTKYGHALPLKKLTLLEAGHPLPDANSAAAGLRLYSFVKEQVAPEDLVFCVFSGGASALLSLPVPGITWQEKQACTKLLLNAGADVKETNAIRKHLSLLKGGNLARLLAPAAVVSLVLSDVVGDSLETVASGPLVADPSTFGDCLETVLRLDLLDRIPASIHRRLEDGTAGRVPETPKPGDPALQSVVSFMVANNSTACAAAAREARRRGYRTTILTTRLEGDTRQAARFHMSIAEEIVSGRGPARRPACLLSGGETTVRVTGTGMGGRNQEFALCCARPLASLAAPCVVASLGTDGTDGPTDAAGAVADNTTLPRSLKFGSRFLMESLDNNDSYHFFKRLGDLIITGPTGTNVMDLHIILTG